MTPSAISRSRSGVVSTPTRRATGMPRSVTRISSPAWARSTHWRRCALRSLTATFMAPIVHLEMEHLYVKIPGALTSDRPFDRTLRHTEGMAGTPGEAASGDKASGRTALQVLLDKQAVAEVVLRYCRGVDRLDLPAVRACYHDDAVDHHTGFDGGPDDYVAWLDVV